MCELMYGFLCFFACGLSFQFGYLHLLNSYNEKHVTDLCGIVYRFCLFEVTLCIVLFMVHDQHYNA